MSGLPALAYIGDLAFFRCTDLKEVRINGLPELISIGENAFSSDTNIMRVDLSRNPKLQEIGDHAFGGCSSLVEINLEKLPNLKTIGQLSFRETNFPVLDLRDSTKLESIGEQAFYGSGLETVNLSGLTELTSLGDSVFWKCMKLKTVDFSGMVSLTALPKSCFLECSSLRQIDLTGLSSLQRIEGRAFDSCMNLESVALEGLTSLETIGDSAFSDCPRLREVDLSTLSGLRTLEFSVFEDCRALQSIVIPEGVTQVGKGCFLNSGLEHIFWNAAQVADFEDAGCLTGGEKPLELVIGKTVGYVPAHLFAGFTDLTVRFEGTNAHLTIGQAALGSLPAGSLGSTYSGTYQVDAQGVLYTEDGKELVYCSPGLTEYTVPAGVTAVRSFAFQEAEGLTKLTFTQPEAVTQLQDFAMAYCRTLGQVNGATTVPGASALFQKAEHGVNVFYATGLTEGGSITWDKELYYEEQVGENGLAKLTISVPQGAQRPDGSYAYLTGQALAAAIQAEYSDADSNTSHAFRICLQGEEHNFWFSYLDYAGGTIQVEDPATHLVVPVSVTRVGASLYYLDFELRAGQSLFLNLQMYYPNGTSDGGGAYLWGGKAGLTQAAIRGVWTVEETPWRLNLDKYKQNLRPVGNAAGELVPDTYILMRLTCSKDTATVNGTYGKNPTTSVTLKSLLTLPEGMEWSPEILEAIQQGQVNIVNNFVYYHYGMPDQVQLLKVEVTCSGVTQSWSLSAPEKGKVALEITLYNPKAYDSVSPADMNDITLYAEFYPECFRFTEAYDLKQTTQIEGTAAFQPSYLFTGQGKQLEDERQMTILPGQLDVRVSKVASRNPAQGGEAETYTIQVTNKGAIPDTLSKVTDTLPVYNGKCYYWIPGTGLDRMFGEETGPWLKVTITNAALQKPQVLQDTVTTMDGGTQDRFTAETITEDASLVLDWNTEQGCVQISVSYGQGDAAVLQTYTVGETRDYPTVAACLDALGYAVTGQDQYSVEWAKDDGEPIAALGPGAVLTFIIYAEAKSDTQMYWNYQIEGGGTSYPNNSMRNYAYAYFGSSNSRDSDYATCIWSRELEIDKSFSVEGGDTTFGSFVHYTLSFQNTRSNEETPVTTDSGMPLTDVMTGPQRLLVPVEKNQNVPGQSLVIGATSYSSLAAAAESGAIPIRTDEAGERYYELGPSGTYQNIYVGRDETGADCLAYQVLVEGTETKISWMASEIVYGSHSITYFAYTDSQYASQEATAFLENTFYIGTAEDYYLYDYVSHHSRLLSIDKAIVVSGAGTDREVLDSDDHCVVRAGESITYRLMLHNYSASLWKVGEVLDFLPLTYGYFDWKLGENVQISAGGNLGVEPYIAKEETGPGQFYLTWPEVTLPAGDTVFYVTLTFPDSAAWEAYAAQAEGELLYNQFSAAGLSDYVTHEVAVPGQAYLQKGVYQMGVASDLKGHPAFSVYTQGLSRTEFSEEERYYSVVTYYVAIYNAGTARLYLTDLQDDLPQGVTFNNLVSNKVTNQDISSPKTHKTPAYLARASSQLTYPSSTSDTASKYLLAQVQDGGRTPEDDPIQYKSVYVTAEQTEDGRLAFTFQKQLDSYEDGNIAYDVDSGLCYLNQGEAVVFGYNCLINGKQADDFSLNTLGMEYYDYTGEGVQIAEQVSAIPSYREDGFGRNDGLCALESAAVASAAYGFQPQYGSNSFLTSGAAIQRGRLSLGLQKEITSVTKGSDEVPYDGVAYETDTLNWTIWLRNLRGTTRVGNYTLTDVMQDPYRLNGTLTYQINGKTSNSYTLGTIRTDDKGNISIQGGPGGKSTEAYELGTDFLLTKSSDKRAGYQVTICITYAQEGNDQGIPAGTQIVTLSFQGAGIQIPSAGEASLTYSTNNPSSKLVKMGTYENIARLRLQDQQLSLDQVSQGYFNQEAGYVESAAQANVLAGWVTSAVKQVTEISDPDNTTVGNENQTITLGGLGEAFRYTLQVANGSSNYAMDTLTFIDVLPYVGDTGVYTNSSRGSQFQVVLAEDPGFTVQVLSQDGAVLHNLTQDSTQEAYFQVDYTASTAGYDTPEEQWGPSYVEGESMAFRIQLVNCKIPALARVIVTFQAEVRQTQVDGEAQYYDTTDISGYTAWNSFAYRYTMQQIVLTVEPPKVGVQVPSAPVLIKTVQTSTGGAHEVPLGTDFTFLVYQSETLQDVDHTRLEQLASVLEEKGIAYTVVRYAADKVNQGQPLNLTHLFQWAQDNGTPGPTEVRWKWQEGQRYTITEVDVPEGYAFNRLNDSTGSQATSFTYQPAALLRLQYQNEYKTWSLVVKKVNANAPELQLSGAVFGLYGSQEQVDMDPNSPSFYETLAQAAGAPATISAGQEETYYFVASATCDSTGQAVFQELSGKVYYLKELEPPAGYQLLEEPILVLWNGTVSSQSITVENQLLGAISILKQELDEKPLSGVTFQLEQKIYVEGGQAGAYTLPDGQSVVLETDEGGAFYWNVLDAKTTGEDGVLKFEELQAENTTYRLTETDTVPGHNLLPQPIEITLPYVTEAAGEQTPPEPEQGYEKDGLYYWYHVTLTVTNNQVLLMPTTDGDGFFWPGLWSAGLILAGAVVLLLRKERRRRRRAA